MRLFQYGTCATVGYNELGVVCAYNTLENLGYLHRCSYLIMIESRNDYGDIGLISGIVRQSFGDEFMQLSFSKGISSLFLVAVGLSWVLVGCSGDAESDAQSVDAAGVVAGTVVFEGKAPKMRPLPVDAGPRGR